MFLDKLTLALLCINMYVCVSHVLSSSSCSLSPPRQLVSRPWPCCLTLLCTWDVSHTWTAREIPVCVSMKWRRSCDTVTKTGLWNRSTVLAINVSFRVGGFLRDRESMCRTSVRQVNVKWPYLEWTGNNVPVQPVNYLYILFQYCVMVCDGLGMGCSEFPWILDARVAHVF